MARFAIAAVSFFLVFEDRTGYEEFYHRLRTRGFVIYPGKLNQADCFRIGTIGRINEKNVEDLITAIGH